MPGQPDQQEVAPQAKIPEVAGASREIVKGILDMIPEGKPLRLDSPKLVSGVLGLYKLGSLEKPVFRNFVQKISDGVDILDPKGEIALDVVTRLMGGIEGNNPQMIKDSLILIDLLGVERNPQVQKIEEQSHIIDRLRKQYLLPQENIEVVSSGNEVETPEAEEPKKDKGGIFNKLVSRRNLLGYAALAALGIAGGGILAAKNRQETTEKPVNIFNELIKPFIDKAFAKRAERAKNDPEYNKRIDKELNANRINIVLFGYGEEHGQTYQDYGGSISVLSYDLRTGQVAAVHLSRDIRAPELEQRLPEDKRQPMTVRQVYKEGGFPLMQNLTEKITGLAVDYQVVVKDVAVADAINALADGSLEIDVPKNHQTTTFNLDGEEHPPGLIPAGKQTMKTMDAMRYILAEDEKPEGKEDERSYRKNQVMEALIESMKKKIQTDPLFLWKIARFFIEEKNSNKLSFDFDTDLFSNALSGIAGLVNAAKKVVGNLGINVEATFPKVNKNQQLVFHDPYFGDGGVTRVHNIANSPNDPNRKDNLKVQEEAKTGVTPPWMLIPDGGDPYSRDLIENYWKSLRQMVKKKLQ